MTAAADGRAGLRLDRPDERGRFGDYGGMFAPETLMPALEGLSADFAGAWADTGFVARFHELLEQYTGRPTPLHAADHLSEETGTRVLLKREDLAHTGAHKINNAIGQALLAVRTGKTRLIAETGAGQHGVATATAAAYTGLECVVYMGEKDIERQALNVQRMRMLGADVVPVTAGAATLKDAVNEAMRDWVRTVEDTHYIIGSAVGPHPFPWMVREFQKIIGDESIRQLQGEPVHVVVACVGGGSNAIGMFYPFAGRDDVELVGVEAGGHGIPTGRHGASIGAGSPGILHGARTYMLQDHEGQVLEAHSISAGPGLSGGGAGARLLRRHGPGPVRVNHRSRGSRGSRSPVADRRNHPRPRVGPRDRLGSQGRCSAGGKDRAHQPLGPRRQGHGHDRGPRRDRVIR